MMKKKRRGPKIKRYGNFLRPNIALRRAATAAGCVFAVAVLAFLGWVIYPPVRDFLQRQSEKPAVTASQSSASEKVSESASSASSATKPSGDASSSSSASSAESEGTTTSQPAASESAAITSVRGIYVPAQTASNSQKLNSLLTQAAAAGNNTVLVEAKSSAGIVYFATENETAAETDAVSSSAYSAERVAEAISSQGMVPAAHVYAFCDPVASTDRDLAVHYGSTDMRWLDNASDQGGKSWLNPCSSAARQYIISLCTELTRAGFERIMIDGVQFPSGYGLDKAGYGTTSFSRSAVLGDFMTELQKQVSALGGSVTLCIPAESIDEGKDEKSAATVDSKNQSLYGGEPEALADGSGMVMLTASSDLSAVQVFIDGSSADWEVCVPAYSLDGSAVTAAEALSTLGTDCDYILYNPGGSYKFS